MATVLLTSHTSVKFHIYCSTIHHTLCHIDNSLRRHQMETFSALLSVCAGNSPVTVEFPSQRPVTRSFDVFFDLRLNKRLSKQSKRRWFEMSSHLLWRYCNVQYIPSFLLKLRSFNSLRPSDAIWRQRTGSTLAQVMACCLTAPSHYLSQCWLITSKVPWLSWEGNFTRDASTINH